MDKRLAKKVGAAIFLWAVVIPLCFVWDIFYKAMQRLMDFWKWVDKQGEVVAEDIEVWYQRF